MTSLLSRLFLLLLVFSTASATENGIRISAAWIAEAPPVSKVHAGYFSLENTSNKKAVLRAVRSKSYDNIEMHLSIDKDGVASMQWLQQLDIEAGQKLLFAPGGYHLMMFRPTGSFKQGDNIELQFEFEDGSTLHSTAVVKKHHN
jgi:copper(I)-binding protein